MLEKTYDAAEAEARIYAAWEAAGVFRAGAGARGGDPFSIVIPPPNVTGSLHMGHALNNTLQDILVRFARMRGRDVLWQPGMDHAGIATQMVVERQLMERQEPGRREIGRETFVEKVWTWKEESGGLILNQLKRLGCSCDWSRERFTMDEGLSRAVTKVFVELHEAGLIYRDKRLVNWDPGLHTAISDIEVEQIEMDGHLWHFRYPVEGEPGRFITVATTRPETMLGDTGVAVHPDDGRYQDLIGKHAILPLVGRRIRIVADEYADPETGSGAVKITPAHDFNDFEVGRRQDLRLVNIFDIEANVVLRENGDFLDGLAPTDELAATIAAVHGIDRYTARERIVAMLDELGFLEKVEDHRHAVPHGDRSGAAIEPFLTDQWYVDAKTLAGPAIASVREGRTTFVPKNWEKTYFEWMENIQPWCISRQLWWGHRIPAWYGPDGKVFVAADGAGAQAQADAHYGAPSELTQDEDVLDTWFSSALWPFSTMGWPDETPELARYYPTTVLLTGFDIIFFWVARMMMFGLHFMKEEPFADVYIHALVRDEQGAKMSKSKGNVIDPLDLIDRYGADALRFTFAAMAAQGRDLRLAEARVEGYRNFTTKIWNAARFAEHYDCRPIDGFEPAQAKDPINRWIATETAHAARAITNGLEAYRFNEAAGAAYGFVWHKFCDWYLELAKPVLAGDDEAARDETRATVAWCLRRIVELLHPFMPFLTEDLAAKLPSAAAEALLAVSAWPEPGFEDADAAADVNWLVEAITAIRSARSDLKVPAGLQVTVSVSGAGEATRARLDRYAVPLKRLARVETIVHADAPLGKSAQVVVGEATFSMPLEGLIDIDAERKRLAGEMKKIEGEIAKIDAKLGNEKFLSRAPEDVVETQRQRRDESVQLLSRTEAALGRISA